MRLSKRSLLHHAHAGRPYPRGDGGADQGAGHRWPSCRKAEDGHGPTTGRLVAAGCRQDGKDSGKARRLMFAGAPGESKLVRTRPAQPSHGLGTQRFLPPAGTRVGRRTRIHESGEGAACVGERGCCPEGTPPVVVPHPRIPHPPGPQLPAAIKQAHERIDHHAGSVPSKIPRRRDPAARFHRISIGSKTAIPCRIRENMVHATGFQPKRADRASRRSANDTTGGKPVGRDRQDASPPAKPAGLAAPSWPGKCPCGGESRVPMASTKSLPGSAEDKSCLWESLNR